MVDAAVRVPELVREPKLTQELGPVALPRVQYSESRELADYLLTWNDDLARRCAAGEDVSGRVDRQILVVEVSPEHLSFGGEDLLSLDGGRIPDGALRGYLIKPLYDALLESNERGQQLRAQSGGACRHYPFSERLRIAVDRGLSAQILSQVLFTAGQAQYIDLHLLVDDPESGGTRPNWSPGEYLVALPTVAPTPTGASLTVHGEAVREVGSLTEAARALKHRYPAQLDVGLAVDGSLTVGAMATAVETVEWDEDGAEPLPRVNLTRFPGAEGIGAVPAGGRPRELRGELSVVPLHLALFGVPVPPSLGEPYPPGSAVREARSRDEAVSIVVIAEPVEHHRSDIFGGLGNGPEFEMLFGDVR